MHHVFDSAAETVLDRDVVELFFEVLLHVDDLCRELVPNIGL